MNPELPIAKEWTGLSFEERFSIVGRRLVEEKQYDAVCYLTSSEQQPVPREPEEQLDWRHFCAAIEARLTYLAKLGFP